ncbi:MAG: DNA-protecting protein DprA [Betaproteobacteria bacterium]|nr:DNA-protecting protein DprA [Betaproteobacteria bacterium]
MGAEDWLESWFRFTLVPGVGPASQRKLLGTYGTPEAVLAARPDEVAGLLGGAAAQAWRKGADPAAVERALRWSSEPGHGVVPLGDDAYPAQLLESGDPPTLLYVLGDVQRLDHAGLAVVGSRNATPSGRETAHDFASAASRAGLTIVSGLALGIDAAAHRGGLSGPGRTIAVVGTGIDIVYPARNRDLAHEIARDGVIISEHPLGTRPAAANFPRRNRIISGLSRGVLVVEAAVRSGSLITARFAAEQGREVFAIPGSIHSPLSRGCHALIKQGAKLVESIGDVLEELGWNSSTARARAEPANGSGDDPLLTALGFDPGDVDTLVERTGLPVETVTVRLLELELEGKVVALGGGRFQRRG